HPASRTSRISAIRIVKRARTRVLAFLNIAGPGMGTGKENDAAGMDAEAAARSAKENPDIIVGFKSAHYADQGVRPPGVRRSAQRTGTVPGRASVLAGWHPGRGVGGPAVKASPTV